MPDIPNRMKRLLREQATVAHERELRRALTHVADAFRQWEKGEITSFQLNDLIHEYHNGPSRELFVKSVSLNPYSSVSHAIGSGILDRAEVPQEVLDYLARAIEYYESDGAEE